MYTELAFQYMGLEFRRLKKVKLIRGSKTSPVISSTLYRWFQPIKPSQTIVMLQT